MVEASISKEVVFVSKSATGQVLVIDKSFFQGDNRMVSWVDPIESVSTPIVAGS